MKTILRPLLTAPLVALSLLAGLHTAAAQDPESSEWINPGTGDWADGSNWSTGGVLNGVDNYISIQNGGTATLSSGDWWYNEGQGKGFDLSLAFNSGLSMGGDAHLHLSYLINMGGVLTLSDNATLDSKGHNILLGNPLDQNASYATLSGNAVWNVVGGYMAVGMYDGKGVLSLTDNARLNVSGRATVGVDGQGTATVSGSAVWTVGSFSNAQVYGKFSDTALLSLGDDGRLVVNGNFTQVGETINNLAGGYACGTAVTEFRLSALRNGGDTDGLAYITAATVLLDNLLNLVSLAPGSLAPGDSLTFLLFDSGSAVDGEFSGILVDGVAVDAADIASLGDHAYQFAAGAYEYTLDYAAGDGTNVTLEVTAAAVPEPGTWAMMLGGFGTLGLFLRRRGAYPAQG